MASDSSSRDLVLAALKESKALEQNERVEEALCAVERVSEHIHNLNPQQAWKLVARIGLLCNRAASASDQPVPYLRRAEALLTTWSTDCRRNKVPIHEHITQVLALTLNNWGTLHQKQTNYHMALSYLMKALKTLESAHSNDAEVLSIHAKTRMNIGSLYMELRRYSDAIAQSEKALNCLQREYKLRRLLGNEEKLVDTVSTFVLCCCSIAQGEEHSRNPDGAKDAYKAGLELGLKHLAPNHPLIMRLKQGLNPALVSSKSHRSTRLLGRKRLMAESANVSPLRSPCNLEKEPGKYYSDQELQILHRHLNEASQVKFISADEFFYNKISRILKLEEDVKHLKGKDEQYLAHLRKEDEDIKKKLNELRLRKHFRHLKVENFGVDFIKERIDYLDREQAVSAKKTKLQLKSKKRLTLKRQFSGPTEASVGVQHQRSTNAFQTAKDEIEGMMENLNQELKEIGNQQVKLVKRQKKKPSGTSCTLARSVLRSNTSVKQQLISNSLIAAFKGRVYPAE